MGKMSYDDAVKVVLRAKRKLGTMPTENDYAKRLPNVDVEELADALGVRKSMERNNVRAYAAVNIEVLHELRRRKGEVVFIAEANEDTIWEKNTHNLFANRLDEE